MTVKAMTVLFHQITQFYNKRVPFEFQDHPKIQGHNLIKPLNSIKSLSELLMSAFFFHSYNLPHCFSVYMPNHMSNTTMRYQGWN